LNVSKSVLNVSNSDLFKKKNSKQFMKLFKKSQPLSQPLPQPLPVVPRGFKKVTYFDENNDIRTALVPEKINIAFTLKPISLDPSNANQVDRSSLYTFDTDHNHNNTDYTIDTDNSIRDSLDQDYKHNSVDDIYQIIDSYADYENLLPSPSPVDSEYRYTIVSLQSSFSSDEHILRGRKRDTSPVASRASSVSNIFRTQRKTKTDYLDVFLQYTNDTDSNH